MTSISSTSIFSNGYQYAWRSASAAVVSASLGCPGALLGGALFGVTHYFFVSTLRAWSAKPNAEARPRELAQWIAELSVKLLASHACTWGLMRLMGFKWAFAQVLVVSLAHVALGLLVAGVLTGLLHLIHVGLLRAVGG